MKILIAITVLLFCNKFCYSQNLDQGIAIIANDLAMKASQKNKVKLTLADFINGEGKTDALTDYIRQELERKLINADNMMVLDRKHLNLILKEHNLVSQGLIDESTIKSVIAFTQIEGIVLADITYFKDQVKIKVTITDISNSLMYAASSSGLINDPLIEEILGLHCSECNGKGTVQTQTTCPKCSGNGSISCADCRGSGRRVGMTVGSYITCEACNGRGKFTCNNCEGKSKIISYQTCPKCNGKVQSGSGLSNSFRTVSPGFIQEKREICPDCTGSGKIKSEATCGSCGGSGNIPFGPRSNWEIKACRTCSGKGSVSKISTCIRCSGTGKL